MTLRAWCLPPGVDPWPDGDRAEAPGGATLVAPAPGSGQVGALLTDIARGGEALRAVPASGIADALGAVGARFLDAADPVRRSALALLPGTAAISPAQARHVLDGMARDWTPGALHEVLRADFGDPAPLDGWTPAALAGAPHHRVRALPLGVPGAPAVHVCAGTVPGVSLTSLLRGLLVKGGVVLKPGAGDVALPLLFVQALQERDDPVSRALAAACAVVWWPGGRGGTLEGAALEGAGALVVYGGDDTVAALRRRAGPGVPVVAYPHRVSFAVAGGGDPVVAGRAVARAAAAYDQRGCVSPRQLFVVGPAPSAGSVAEALAAELEALDGRLPPGPSTPDEAAAVQQLRGTAELRAAAGEAVRIYRGGGTRWTVVVDPEPTVRLSCLSRTVHVTPVDDVQRLVGVLAPVARHLQTVGLTELPDGEAFAVADALATLGASRICPVDAMAFPGPGWRHDGDGPLRRLVRWCGLEGAPGAGR